jgi:hypothetical protein
VKTAIETYRIQSQDTSLVAFDSTCPSMNFTAPASRAHSKSNDDLAPSTPKSAFPAESENRPISGIGDRNIIVFANSPNKSDGHSTLDNIIGSESVECFESVTECDSDKYMELQAIQMKEALDEPCYIDEHFIHPEDQYNDATNVPFFNTCSATLGYAAARQLRFRLNGIISIPPVDRSCNGIKM